ncbi:hypothetical protein ACJMK2_042398 [Sinanodonta woodiana]|uniref:Uncharacterized protein n=1 Tax=Sinanodonta woodiana TaxID=1069815 RepID=A0ABD3W799_SINWO
MASANSTEKEKSLRRVVERFADKSAMQGLPFIRGARFWWSRLIWIVLTLAAISAMTLHLYYITNIYNEHPVQTKDTFEDLFGYGENDGYDRRQLPRNSHGYVHRHRYPTRYGYVRQQLLEGTDTVFLEQLKKEFGYVREQIFKTKYMDLPSEDRKAAGHFMKDMIVSCSFSGRECNENSFKLHQTADYGNCWEWNSTDRIVTVSGDKSAISFQVQVSRLGEPYSKCNDGKAFEEQYGLTFTRQACQFICLTSTVIRICGCYEARGEEMALMVNGTTPRCENGTGTCIDQITLKFHVLEYSYTRTISSRPWPTDRYAQILVKEVCNKSTDMCTILKKNYTDSRSLSYNFLKLNVYFEDLNYEIIEETPKIETFQFMSDVGGAIGLWIGMSALALCEILHLILDLCSLGMYKLRSTCCT